MLVCSLQMDFKTCFVLLFLLVYERLGIYEASSDTTLTMMNDLDIAKSVQKSIIKKIKNFKTTRKSGNIRKTFGPEKCSVYLKLPWIGNASSKFENQINKAITSCFFAVKPRVVYSTRVMLPSAKKVAFLPPKKIV